MIITVSSFAPPLRAACARRAIGQACRWRPGTRPRERVAGGRSGKCSPAAPGSARPTGAISPRFYLDRLPQLSLLTVEPLGWSNIEQFLKLGPCTAEGQKGCFAVSSIRELAILPPAATEMLGQGRVRLKQLIAKNIAAEKPKTDVNDLVSIVLTFFTGLSVEQNLKPSRAATGRKVDSLIRVLRGL
jgi:hypothetical protein